MRRAALAGAAAIAALAAVWLLRPDAAPPSTSAAIVVPALSAEATAGAALFDANCAACHGPNAAGTDWGPPLVHKIYEPSHHGDAAFHLAVRNGVRAHHWPYGDMPPVPGVSEADATRIIAYVRELQRANGID